jgi:hypothetical protein
MLQAAAATGPVVVVNISQFRSDALIVRSSGSPILVSLPNATLESVGKIEQALIAAKELSDEPENTQPKQVAFFGVLASIWTQVVEPVVQKLDEVMEVKATEKKRIRIWWIPSSKAWRFPLHAAGIYETGGIKLPDRFISSYTPSLTMLARHLNSHKKRTTFSLPKILHVTVPGSDPKRILTKVEAEASAIRGSRPNIEIHRLKDNLANPQTVLTRMKTHSWIHFSCHGVQEAKPFDSCFKTGKTDLRLIDIIKENLPDAELAFLAACHSAAGDDQTPNETIHLAAGMQFAGYRSVIGTMWAMADEDGPLVAKVFYEYMFRRKNGRVDCADAAEALAKVTRELRRRGVPFSRWINFVHFGV